MSARSQTSCRLRVESLEDRSLLSAPVNAIELASLLDSFPAVAALVDRQLANGAGNSGGQPARFGAVGNPNAADLERISLTDLGPPPLANRVFPNGSDVRQAVERLEERAHDAIDSLGAVLAPPAPPSITQVRIDFDPNRLAHVPPLAGAAVAIPPATRSADEIHGIAIPKSESVLTVSEYGPATGDAAGYVPPSDTPVDTPDAVPSASPLDAISSAWRDVFRDPLAGTLIGEAVSADFRTLDAAAREFFEHLANLAPDWCPESEWSEYLLLVAGVLLGGGSYYARRARGKGTRPPGRPPHGEAEA